MKKLARVLLKVVTAGIPVVIAACYGPAYRYFKSGKVVDKATGTGIQGISVTCKLADGTMAESDVTYTEGEFSLGYDTPCASLVAEDTDGAANGSYVTTEVPFDQNADDVTIQMPAKQQ